MDAMNFFSVRLKKLRESAGLTQSQLGEELDVSRGSIGYYEKSERIPDIEFLKKTADYFKVSLDYLMGQSDNLLPEGGSIQERFFLSDKAIENLDTFSKSFDLKTKVLLVDILNALLENPKFKSILFDISSYLSFDEENADGIVNFFLKKSYPDRESKIQDAMTVQMNMILLTFQKLIEDMKDKGIKTYLNIEEIDGNITISLPTQRDDTNAETQDNA